MCLYVQEAQVLVCGTLGQAFEDTGEAVRRAVTIARDEGVCVFVDVNWRPVFFRHPEDVHDDIVALVHQAADIVKLTDDEAEWMFGIDAKVALRKPCQVRSVP